MQDILAILIVAAAAAFLARRAWLHFARRQSGACGSCSSCGTSETVKSVPLVSLSTNMPYAETQRRSAASAATK